MIADVREKGSYIEVYDSKGNRISRMSTGDREIVGVASSFFVVVHGSYIEVYDEDCDRISRMSQGDRIVRGASGETFTVKHGSYIEIYDKDCERISRKSAWLTLVVLSYCNNHLSVYV